MPNIGDRGIPAAPPPASQAELEGLLVLNEKPKVYKTHTMAIPPPDPTSNRSKGGRHRRTKKAES